LICGAGRLFNVHGSVAETRALLKVLILVGIPEMAVASELVEDAIASSARTSVMLVARYPTHFLVADPRFKQTTITQHAFWYINIAIRRIIQFLIRFLF
jgi:hypothetical protein